MIVADMQSRPRPVRRPSRASSRRARTRLRIVALGDLVVDIVAATKEPLAHASDAAGAIVFRQGGSAANTARWIARLGGEAAFVGAVGRDEWGRRLGASLTDAGVRVHLVRRAGRTARIVALVEPGGERTFVTDRGAADQLTPEDLRAAWFAGAAGLHLPAYSLLNEPLGAAARRAAELARAAGATVSVDLASRRPLLSHGRRTAWERIAALAPDLLFANAGEAAALAGARGEHHLLDLAPVVVVKEGPGGCRIIVRGPRQRRRCRAGPPGGGHDPHRRGGHHGRRRCLRCRVPPGLAGGAGRDTPRRRRPALGSPRRPPCGGAAAHRAAEGAAGVGAISTWVRSGRRLTAQGQADGEPSTAGR